MSDSLWPHGLYSPWNSPGQNTWVGSCFLLQGIFPTQGLNLGLLHCREIIYQLSHKGSPRILEWVAYPFSSGSSWLRNQTRVSCTAGRFFTSWAIREAPNKKGTRSNSYLKKNRHISMERDCRGQGVCPGRHCGCCRGSGWWWPGLRGSAETRHKHVDLGCILEIELTELAGQL